MKRLKWLSRSARSVAPYLLVEMLLPGGTLVALLLWLSQRARLHPPSGPWRLPPRDAPTALIQAGR
jgi:hypothetical protein